MPLSFFFIYFTRIEVTVKVVARTVVAYREVTAKIVAGTEVTCREVASEVVGGTGVTYRSNIKGSDRDSGNI